MSIKAVMIVGDGFDRYRDTAMGILGGKCDYAFEADLLKYDEEIVGIRISCDMSDFATAVLFVEDSDFRNAITNNSFYDFTCDFSIDGISNSSLSTLKRLDKSDSIGAYFLREDVDGVLKSEPEIAEGYTVKQLHNGDLINGLTRCVINAYK